MDLRRSLPRSTREARRADQALVELPRQIAGDKGATPGQIALASAADTVDTHRLDLKVPQILH